MTVAVLSSFANPAPPAPLFGLDRTNSSSRHAPNMLKSWKRKLGGNKKDAAASRQPSFKSESVPHPQLNQTPATRRPAPVPNTRSARDNNDPPPAYTPAPNAASIAPADANAAAAAASTSSASPRDVADDPYAFLSSFDTIFLIDDSGSMAGGRWRETLEALSTVAPICTAHDADGVDLYFLNHPDRAAHHNVTSAAAVREIFASVRPGGGTPTGQRLNALLKPYLRRLEAAADEASVKPLNIICITDGEPSDDVESVLIAAARKLDRLDAPAWQIGVQFFQVGRDEEARRHLRQLDDELAEIAGDDEMRDIVDTVPFTGEEGTHLTGDGILKVVLGAVNRRLDRRRSKDLHQ